MGVLAGLLLALGAPGAAAASGVHRARGAAAPDTLRHGPTPFHVMLRSAVVPGWGQLTNHKLIKAVVVVGGEGLLVYKSVDELRKENDAVALASSIDPNVDPLGHDAALAAIERHYNLKLNYIWWGIALHLVQMADAFVDAHLATFDVDFGPDAARLDPISGSGGDPGGGPGLGRKDGPRFAVAVHVRF